MEEVAWAQGRTLIYDLVLFVLEKERKFWDNNAMGLEDSTRAELELQRHNKIKMMRKRWGI